MYKRFSQILCLLLSLLLLLPLFPAALAEEETEEEEAEVRTETIHILTAQDLLDLSLNCTLDTWSDNKSVILDADLSLSGVDFEAIPFFNGKFDGRGHTIYDLEINAAQSPCGFFLETGKDASVHDLNLSGSVISRGDDSQVGGVTGLNRGLLTNCSFSGQVDAISQVGGIAGKNEATGIITACSASGRISGLSTTGGIVGENSGTIIACQNHSFVNTESVDPNLRIDSIDTSSIINFLHSLRADSAGITSDIGGVAGFSRGFVERCSNDGTVGYLHLGYNVGGIVGRSCGFLNGCTNNGEVYGRKDVGGIVGQAEPFVEAVEAENLAAGLSYRVYALNQSVNAAIEDARGVSGGLVTQLANIPAYLVPIRDAIVNIDLMDPEGIWNIQYIVIDCVGAIELQLQQIGASVGTNSTTLLNDLQAISDNANALSNTAIQTLNMISDTSETTDILVDNSGSGDETLLTLGKVAECVNSSSIYGDSNVGGIAGNISLENDMDPESELLSSHNSITRNTVNLYAVVVRSVNRGGVTAKNECAGGIVGKMDFGLSSNCASYGTVTLEDGEYAGGVCGLCYGSIQACCAKCSIGGSRYIGGIVGNGYAARSREDKASLVSGCYALTEILDQPHFAGAISGGGAGTYENNFFVDAGYAGLNRVSIRGQAEPISFADFAAVEDLPDDCKHFTLRFVVDGETIREIGFEYGDSFDRDAFPKLEPRDGAYAVWDRTDLHDLRFDTTVTAEYRKDETVLRSGQERADGRAVFYVDGQFQHGDIVELTQIDVEEDDIRAFSSDWKETVRRQLNSIFRDRDPDYSIPVAVTEHIHVSFPDDGLDSHSLRYLAPDGQTANYRLYLREGDGWQRIRPDTFGSYFLFEVPETEAEVMLVSTIQSWWIVAYIAAGLLIFLLLIIALVKLRKVLHARPKKAKAPRKESVSPRRRRAKRRAVIAAVILLLLAAGGTAAVLRFGSIGPAMTAYRALKTFSQTETDVLTEIGVHTGTRDIEMNTTVHRVLQDGKMIRCTEQYGVPLYISGGQVYLENGRSFSITDGQLGQGEIIDLALDIFLHRDVRVERAGDDAYYEAVINGETAERILSIFLSADQEQLLKVENMTAGMRTASGALARLSFTGSGSTESGTPFTFSAVLTPQPMGERPVIPQAVQEAIASGVGGTTQILSEELLRLVSAWVKNESAENVSADISVSADCGAVNLNPHYRYFRTTVDDTEIYSIQSTLFKLYFTDSAACTATGADLSEAQQRVLGAADLIPIAREFCLKGDFTCVTADERTDYTVTLDPESTEDIVSRLVPELKSLNITYEASTLKITVEDGAISAISLESGGSLRIVARDVETSVRISARFNDNPIGTIPARVRKALLE